MNKGIRLLIADDHVLFQNGLRLILKEVLHIDDVALATNGKEAIAMCRREAFDVVIMDINMPVIDGVAATREIKIYHPDTKVLIVSMLSDLAHIKAAMKAGADGFLIKNADADEFAKALTSIQQDKIYVSEYFNELLHTDEKATREDYIRFTEGIITNREKSILKMITEGFTNAEIAEALYISVATVNTHRNNLLAKLNLPNTAALVRFALDNRLV